MHPSEHKRLTHYSPLVVMSVFGLMIGLYIAVIGSQTSQENRSRAAIVNGTYNGTLQSSSNIINGGVTGDVIGNSNTVSGNVAGCVRGNSNIIGGRVSGTVTGSGNIVALGSGGGPCLSGTPTPAPTAIPSPTTAPTMTKSPTPSPTKTPTPTPTKTPTPTQGVTPGLTLVPTAIPTATKTPTPTPSQTVTITPTPTATQPTATTGPTATPEPNSTLVAVSLLLHGVGKGGDSVNPTAQGNMNPLHPNRVVTVDVYDANNQLVVSKQGTVIFNPTDGNFKGNISLGSTITTGAHTIRIKGDQYLRGIVSGIQMLTAGQTKTLPSLTLVSGDVNNDNQINIVDYNLLVGCYSDLLPPVSCNAGDNVKTDLNDDGNVNQFDYNLFIRELTNLGGQ